MNKATVISGIYYDKAGYGSIKTTWQDAKKKDSSITIKDVRDWFSDNIEQKNSNEGIIVLSLLMLTLSIKLICFSLTIYLNRSLTLD